MLSFENFVKSMPPSLSELKVTPSFCFAFKIPDNVAASNTYGSLDFFSEASTAQKNLGLKIHIINVARNTSVYCKRPQRTLPEAGFDYCVDNESLETLYWLK